MFGRGYEEVRICCQIESLPISFTTHCVHLSDHTESYIRRAEEVSNMLERQQVPAGKRRRDLTMSLHRLHPLAA